MEESRLGRWPWPGRRGATGMLCKTVRFLESSLHLLGLEETGLVEARLSPHPPSVSQMQLPPGLFSLFSLFSLLLLVRGDVFLAVLLQPVACVFCFLFFCFCFFMCHTSHTSFRKSVNIFQLAFLILEETPAVLGNRVWCLLRFCNCKVLSETGRLG